MIITTLIITNNSTSLKPTFKTKIYIMKKYEIALILLFLLGVTLKLHAQKDSSSIPTIQTLQGNNEYNTSLSQSWTKNELDDRIKVPTQIGYYFKIS